MSDNHKKIGKSDRERINKSQPGEIEYWTKKLGVSPQQLRGAIQVVGPIVKKVKEYLKQRSGS